MTVTPPRRSSFFFLALAAAVLPALAFPGMAAPPATLLDRYVQAPDPHYGWRLVSSQVEDGVTTDILELTSQQWLTEKEVDRPVWQHWLVLSRPANPSAGAAFLVIGGGRHDSKPPAPRPDNVQLARETNSIVAELRNVPSQPLIFHQDGQPRSEDALVAYTWDQFLRTGDERWPARLPMTKAVVRAMDAIQEFCHRSEGGGVRPEKFVLAGASKRGWTAWLTAAVDPRVSSVVPIVIDVPNVEVSMRHHYAAYGFWAPAIDDYSRLGLMNWFGTPENRALMAIEDPFSYRERLTMPKFLVNASGDQFFLPDSWQFYLRELPGVTYLRYVPNADHSLKNTDAWSSIRAWYRAIKSGQPLPRFAWKLTDDGGLEVTADDPPATATLWQATNPAARDFRLETLGAAWTRSPVTVQGDTYSAKVSAPKTGWTAFFIELTYPQLSGPPLTFTTGVRVIPDKTDHTFVPQKTD